jgi:hypothetical protein
MTTHISQNILNKIEKENIKPKARWYFVVEHAVLWVPGILVTSLGAIAIAGILYGVAHSGSEYKDFVYSSKKDFLIAAAPVLWILSFFLFNSLIVQALRTTHEGYRLSVKKIIFGSFAVSTILGASGYLLDEKFEVNSLIRYPVHVREEQIWLSPSEGRIAGRIEKKSDDELIVRDKNNTVWFVDMSGFGSTTFPFVEEGKSLRVIGTRSKEVIKDQDDEGKNGNVFIACAVFPWEIGEPFHGPRPPRKNNQDLKPRILHTNQNPDCKIILDILRKFPPQPSERK